MALILDTQVIIWIEENPHRISDPVKDRIFSGPEVYFCKASVWEMAIKLKTGKLTLKQSLPIFIRNFEQDYQFKILEISLPHIYQTQELPLHHRDPFDRLLVAQSLTENIPVISSDEILDAYNVNRIW